MNRCCSANPERDSCADRFVRGANDDSPFRCWSGRLQLVPPVGNLISFSAFVITAAATRTATSIPSEIPSHRRMHRSEDIREHIHVSLNLWHVANRNFHRVLQRILRRSRRVVSERGYACDRVSCCQSWSCRSKMTLKFTGRPRTIQPFKADADGRACGTHSYVSQRWRYHFASSHSSSCSILKFKRANFLVVIDNVCQERICDLGIVNPVEELTHAIPCDSGEE